MLEALDQLGTESYSGVVHRHVAPGRDPLSGEGARLIGGRWNERDGVPTAYLAHPRDAALAELGRLMETQPGAVRFPRRLFTIEVDGLDIIDLTTTQALATVGLTLDDIRADDRGPCQHVGAAVAFMGHQGLIAPSATGTGLVLAVFEQTIRQGQLVILDEEELEEPSVGSYDPPRSAS